MNAKKSDLTLQVVSDLSEPYKPLPSLFIILVLHFVSFCIKIFPLAYDSIFEAYCLNVVIVMMLIDTLTVIIKIQRRYIKIFGWKSDNFINIT